MTHTDSQERRHASLSRRGAIGALMAAGWHPTVDNYLGRVPKVGILEAVPEANGEQSAQLIDHLKKADLAKEAERLLEGAGWVPVPLRLSAAAPAAELTADTEGQPAALPALPRRWLRGRLDWIQHLMWVSAGKTASALLLMP